MLSIIQAIGLQRRMKEWLKNIEIKNMLTNQTWLNLQQDYEHGTCLNTVDIGGIWIEIWSRDLPNTKEEGNSLDRGFLFRASNIY